MDPQTLQAVAAAAGDVKELLDALKAAGVTSPALDAADQLAGAVQAATAAGTLDPRALVPAMVADLQALRQQATNPVAKATLGLLARLLGKLSPPASGGGA